jgi:radical S-adenosyl methionine domain-containing protein 2
MTLIWYSAAMLWKNHAETLVFFTAAMVLIPLAWRFVYRRSPRPGATIPISVNYHFTRQCNKTCGFCFHTATTSFRLPEDRACRGLALLSAVGMRKINFAGGEPFMYKKFLGTMIAFCKEQLRLESVSIVTNGSLVDDAFLRTYGRHIDILAVSCDSFDEQTNIAIGRGSGNQVKKLFEIADLCRKYNIKFKLNTVVCRLNYKEDMNATVEQLRPFRWKCFQVLLVAGENDSNRTLRDVRKYQISDEEYELFCHRHRHQKSFVAEPNILMAKSYLILDEYMRFLDREGRVPSSSILDTGVYEALGQVYWDAESFARRGGIYDWAKEAAGCGGSDESKLQW